MTRDIAERANRKERGVSLSKMVGMLIGNQGLV